MRTSMPCKGTTPVPAAARVFSVTSLLLKAMHPCDGSPPMLLQVEIKPDMIGGYLAEYSISYKPVKHGKPGIGATHSSRFIPLK